MRIQFENGSVFYDQLAFDGLAVGYKTDGQGENQSELRPGHLRDVNSQSGKDETSNLIRRAPVRTVPAAAREAYLIDCKALRAMIFEPPTEGPCSADQCLFGKRSMRICIHAQA